MARTPKEQDEIRLSKALDTLMGIIEASVPADLHPEDKAILENNLLKSKLDASGKLVLLLERHAKMHGYDSASGQGEDEGSIAAVKRRLEAVK